MVRILYPVDTSEQEAAHMKTKKQEIAELEARLARAKTEDRAMETGQKIILGGMLLQAARKDPKMAAWVIEEAERVITRKIDQKRVAPILEELKAAPAVTALGLTEVA